MVDTGACFSAFDDIGIRAVGIDELEIAVGIEKDDPRAA